MTAESIGAQRAQCCGQLLRERERRSKVKTSYEGDFLWIVTVGFIWKPSREKSSDGLQKEKKKRAKRGMKNRKRKGETVWRRGNKANRVDRMQS